MSCRQAALTRAIDAKDTKDTKDRDDLRVLSVDTLTLVGNGGHLPWPERLQERAGVFEIELRVACFDAQEEPVAARQREARDVEHRVVRLRQSVQRKHPEDRRQ